VIVLELDIFELERIQSEWEHIVELNLSESGIEALSVKDLLNEDELRSILKVDLSYSQTNGEDDLRRYISKFYSKADSENILVTNGGAEANFIAIWNLLHESKDRTELVMMLPNYMQIHGIGKAFGARVTPFELKVENNEWTANIESLKEIASRQTTVIAICNPNNPTGAKINSQHLKAIADIADDCDTWILSDEVYQGSEHDGIRTPSMFDFYDKVIVVNSLSKSYGLPGLRIGWLASPSKERVKEFWAYSDYTTICPTTFSSILATRALHPDNRIRILKRTQRIIKENWSVMKNWLDERESIFDYITPRAAPFCFPKHNLEMSSLHLVEKLIQEKSVLIIPGEHFGFLKYLRIGFGYDLEKLHEGLKRFSDLLDTLH
jgi:hypothetical protein